MGYISASLYPDVALRDFCTTPDINQETSGFALENTYMVHLHIYAKKYALLT